MNNETIAEKTIAEKINNFLQVYFFRNNITIIIMHNSHNKNSILDLEIKNKISHRARALVKAINILKEIKAKFP